MNDRLDVGAEAVAALADRLRRTLYLFIRGAGRPVTREEAAKASGISRKLAAFHLDKLVDAGLLATHYARPPGRSGPGAGRTAKYYEPSAIEVDLSIPERRYDLLGRLLVEAVRSERRGEKGRDAAVRVAQAAGTEVGESVRREARLRRLGPERTLAVAAEVLERYGYEPFETADGDLKLRNCPFHALAKDAPDLVCEMNRSYLDGLIRGLGNETVTAELTRVPGECCVTLQRATRHPASG